MTDDEINRKVAEIEGWRQVGSREAGRRWMPPGTPPEFNIFALHDCPPPYTTDWAWCGPLVERYRIEVYPWKDDLEWSAFVGGFESMTAWTPQRAVCLAVIAAHENKP